MELEEWGNHGSIRIGEINMDFDLPITITISQLPESFRESESKLFSANEQPSLKHTEIAIEVPGKVIEAMRNLIWIGAILVIAGFALVVYCLIKK